ncbi:hypothetical protein KIK06_17470 [Nocardiopsis sp. EMB25]|uniref:hypothetical protein n=1 Tax=Nocardiopsis sp. EMB25 TaxID=2835867 RepID=UPI00228442D4|nr:hypothetical protein [Nocardiopsis sp. EMB25]MCY9785678.1 hypothetical protein [Nocardiopsis sp. EMB25]
MAKGTVARSTARMLERRSVTRSGVTRISVLAALAAAVWFSQADTLGCLVGSAFLGAVLFCDAVRARIRADRRDALTMWVAAMLGQLREYVVYVGLTLGAVAEGVQGAWGWAAGALIALALRDAFLVARSAPAAPGHGLEAALEGEGSTPGSNGGTDGRGGLTAGLVPPPRREPRENDPRLTGRLLGDASARATATEDPDHRTRSDGPEHHDTRPPRTAGAPLPIAIRRVMVFTQPTRFLVIAVAATAWDARVAFLTLIVGCALAVTGELVDPTAREAGK